MKMIKKIFPAFILVLFTGFLLTGCNQKKKGSFFVTVNYKNLGQMVSPAAGGEAGSKAANNSKTAHMMLQEIPYGGDLSPIILDSATLKQNDGSVTLKGNGKEEGIYQLVVENGPMLLLINDEEAIQVDVDLSKSENYYSVKGSEASAQLKEFIQQYSEKSFVVNKAFAELDSLKQTGGSDSLLIIATEKKNKGIKNVNTYMQDFLNKSNHPALSLFALGWSSRSFPREDFEKALANEVKKFPEHNMLKKMKAGYETQEAQASGEEARTAENTWVGKAAPALSLPTPEGDTITLASFRGKFLLIDFWASWCGPCRQENPNVVKAFNQFKDKNFTILGVSLDQEKSAWLKAIKDDQLAWTQVSDLKYWNSKAVDIYGFEGIPYNVLVNPQGVVIAENLRGFDLENKLQEVLK